MPNVPTIEGSVPGSIPDPIDELKHDQPLAVIPPKEVNVQAEAQVNRHIEVQARGQDDNQGDHPQSRIQEPSQNQNLRSRVANRNNSLRQSNLQTTNVPQNDNMALQADEFGNIHGALRDQGQTSNRLGELQNNIPPGPSIQTGNRDGVSTEHREHPTANFSGGQQPDDSLG